MQVVVDLLLDEVADVFVDGDSVGTHRERTELDFRLALEHRLLDIDGDGGHQSVADVAVFVALAREFLDGLGDVLLESALVGAALRGVLAVDEGVVLLAVLVGVGEGDFDVLALHVDDGIDAGTGHGVVEQVLEPVAAEDAATVVHDGQPGVEVGVVAQHGLHDLVVETVVLKQAVVGLKPDVGAGLVGGGLGGVGLQPPCLEGGRAHLSVAVGPHLEAGTQGIDGLHADAVESDALLEGLGVVFAAGVELADGFDELALRDAAAVVAHADAKIVLDVYLDALAGVHLKLVDGVVDDFLEQDVDAVFGQRTVA